MVSLLTITTTFGNDLVTIVVSFWDTVWEWLQWWCRGSLRPDMTIRREFLIQMQGVRMHQQTKKRKRKYNTLLRQLLFIGSSEGGRKRNKEREREWEREREGEISVLISHYNTFIYARMLYSGAITNIMRPEMISMAADALTEMVPRLMLSNN
jgi:hypothetical protein